MGLALYEMYEVSGLVIGDAPYEEYVPSTEELYLLKKKRPSSVRDVLGGIVPLLHLRAVVWMEREIQADVMSDLSVPRGE